MTFAPVGENEVLLPLPERMDHAEPAGEDIEGEIELGDDQPASALVPNVVSGESTLEAG